MRYDFLIVGAGVYGGTFAREAIRRGKRVLVVEKRDRLGGMCAGEIRDGIDIHLHGSHVFHTSDKEIWRYAQQIAELRPIAFSPVANYRGEIYPLPFNMNTFTKLWRVSTPDEARARLEAERVVFPDGPKDLEEQALSLVGREIYEKLIRGYTEKQWGRPCSELPPSIIRRIPVRFTYDCSYHNCIYQCVPEAGWNSFFEALFAGADVRLSTDFLADRAALSSLADKIVYTGPIDAYFDKRFGALEYRGLRFETELVEKPSYQGVAVMNFTDRETPQTRIVEHKHFFFSPDDEIPITYITREYPIASSADDDPYYPINDARNEALLKKYRDRAKSIANTIFAGRLAEYRYLDIDETIKNAIADAKKIIPWE